jgi:ElaB/YqjD/DUF883 family membrane-anchored ribosome-binding protein
MRSYDRIRSRLESAVEEARDRHNREVEERHRTASDLAHAIEQYVRFTLHGMIPEDFQEDGEE